MVYKMSDLKGIDQDLVAKLHAAGVQTTSDVMAVWQDRDRRTQVPAQAGLSSEQFDRMVSLARMARMEGVGPKYADLLVGAGIIGSKSLATRTPEALLQHLREMSAARNRTGPIPTLVEIGHWYATLKPVSTPVE